MSQKIVEYVNRVFEDKKSRNSSYTIRSFARDLRIDQSVLSRILNGNRQVTLKQATRIFDSLDTKLDIRNGLLLTLDKDDNYQFPLEESDQEVLEDEELLSTFKWYYYAVMCALEIPRLEGDLEKISEFLKIGIEEIRSVIDFLKSKNAITEQEGKYQFNSVNFTTSALSKEGLQKAHTEHLNKAIDYIKTVKGSECSFAGHTISMPTSKVSEAKRRINEFAGSMTEWLTDEKELEDFDSVYRLNVQLFPLAKVEND